MIVWIFLHVLFSRTIVLRIWMVSFLKSFVVSLHVSFIVLAQLFVSFLTWVRRGFKVLNFVMFLSRESSLWSSLIIFIIITEIFLVLSLILVVAKLLFVGCIFLKQSFLFGKETSFFIFRSKQSLSSVRTFSH